MERQDVERLIREKPDYVIKALDKWFKEVPKEEADKPIMGIYSKEPKPITYTPRQMYDETEKALSLVIELPFNKRVEAVKKMPDIPKMVLREIITIYGE